MGDSVCGCGWACGCFWGLYARSTFVCGVFENKAANPVLDDIRSTNKIISYPGLDDL